MLHYTTYSQKYEPTEDDTRKDLKKLHLYGGTEIIVRNRCSYNVTAMVGTNDYTNEKHKLYNSTLPEISIGGGDCATKVGSLCSRFFDMGAPVKTHVENGLSKIFDLRGHTIDVSDQAVFILKYLGIHDE